MQAIVHVVRGSVVVQVGGADEVDAITIDLRFQEDVDRERPEAVRQVSTQPGTKLPWVDACESLSRSMRSGQLGASGERRSE